MAEIVSRIPRGEEVRWVVEEEESSILKAASTCKWHKRGSRSLSLSCGKSQHIESTAQLRLLHKGSTRHIWILGMAPKWHLLWAKPSAKLKEDNSRNTGHVPVIKMAQGQPKPPPTASDKTRQVSEGKLREAKARMGHAPNFKEWSEGTPHCLRRTLGVVREKKKTSYKGAARVKGVLCLNSIANT